MINELKFKKVWSMVRVASSRGSQSYKVKHPDHISLLRLNFQRHTPTLFNHLTFFTNDHNPLVVIILTVITIGISSPNYFKIMKKYAIKKSENRIVKNRKLRFYKYLI